MLEPDKGLVPRSMGFEPGGSYVWAVLKDRTLALFALGDAAPRPVTSAAVGLLVDAVSDDGDLALVRDPSGSASVFALDRPDRPPRPLKGLDHPVKHVQTPRDLSRMVAASRPPSHVPEFELVEPTGPSTVSAWDLASDPPRRLTLRPEIGPVKVARISRDGRWLLAAGERGYAVRDFWSVPTVERGYPLGTFFSPDGVIPEGRDSQLTLDGRVLYLADLARLDAGARVLATHVTAFAADPTGDRVVTLGPAGVLRVYRLRAVGRTMSEQLQPLLSRPSPAVKTPDRI